MVTYEYLNCLLGGDKQSKEEGSESCEGNNGTGSAGNIDQGSIEDGCSDNLKEDCEGGKDLLKMSADFSLKLLGGAKETEALRQLRLELKKALNDSKEMKLLLDMYKGVGKEQRDKVQVMAAEKKVRLECEDLKSQVKKLQDSNREERKKLADEEAIRKIKHMDESIHSLQKQVQAQKAEEEALLNEMEVTGQAFEDMQEQNIRLINQLREKDDANFKLMSERIKSNQINKLANEERDALNEQNTTLTTQVAAQNQVVRKLEEKERLLQNR